MWGLIGDQRDREMDQLSLIAIWALLVLGGLAGAMLLPSVSAFTMRALFRQSPEAKRAFVGRGRWIAFSKRFGLPCVVGAVAAAFIWIWLAPRFLPDTEVGAWLLFGPAIFSMMLGVCLGALVIARWTVGDPES
jgi:hypothetical protein